jgi:hypothetical protein
MNVASRCNKPLIFVCFVLSTYRWIWGLCSSFLLWYCIYKSSVWWMVVYVSAFASCCYQLRSYVVYFILWRAFSGKTTCVHSHFTTNFSALVRLYIIIFSPLWLHVFSYTIGLLLLLFKSNKNTRILVRAPRGRAPRRTSKSNK